MDLPQLIKPLPAIKKFWSVTNTSSQRTVLTQPMVFDGCMEIIICRTGGFALQFENIRHSFSPGIYIAGQITEPMALCLAANTQLDFVKIEHGFANLLSNENMAQLTGIAVELFDLNKSAYDLLLPFFESANQWRAIGKLNEYMMSRRCANSEFSVFASQALSHIAPYSTLKRNLLDKSQLSTRSFETRFKRSIGVNPKKYASLLKLRQVTETLRDVPVTHTLTNIAYDMGFYDQAHFCRSISQFLGVSARKVDFSNWFVPDSREAVRFYTI